MAEAAAARSDALGKGATIGRYLVLSLVGRGGMGEVYAAYDPELDRKVAVKLLRGHAAGTSDDAGRVRLLREAQAIAKLSHPNVVVVYDVGGFRDGVFIAMEFVDGKTVSYWLQAEQRAWRDVLKIFLAAGRGLLAAHLAGMVHRDFKPDNVMITNDGQVRVMDFGLARRLDVTEKEPPPMSGELRQLVNLDEVDPATVDLDATSKLGAAVALPGSSSGSYLEHKLTQTGAMLGTPAYMSPEQFAAAATDARTDQFSFCVALYEALYGQRPFEGDNVISLMANVVSGTFRPEPDGTTVPPRLRKILLRGLSPDPDQRFPSMADLLLELEKDPASLQRVWLTSVAVATVLVAALVGVGKHLTSENTLCGGAGARLAGIWESGGDSARKRQIKDVFLAKGKGNAARLYETVVSLLDGYVDRWTAMYRDACEATHVRGDQSAEVLDLRMGCLGQRLTSVKALTDVLANADATVIENAVTAAGAMPNLERCADVAMLRGVAPPADEIRGRVDALRGDTARARALGDAGQCEKASAVAGVALKGAHEIGYLPLIAEAAYVEAQAGKFCTDEMVTAKRYEDAVLAAESAQDDEIAVTASGDAAVKYSNNGDNRPARFWVRHAEAVLKRLPGHPMLEIFTMVNRGAVDQTEGHFEAAVEEQMNALAAKERVLGPMHPDTALSAMNVCNALHDQGRDAEAEKFGRRAVETLTKLLGGDGAQVAFAGIAWAEALTGIGRTREAREQLERAIGVWTRLAGAPIFLQAAQVDLARIDLLEKHPADALKRLEPVQPALADTDAQYGPQATLLLADALWATSRERGRAMGLARGVKEKLVKAGGAPQRLAEVDAWLRTHATP